MGSAALRTRRRLRPAAFSRGLIIAGLLCIAVAGCGKSAPEDIKLKGDIVVSPGLNPDLAGRPSPVVIAIYQLAAIDVFENSDFFSVYDPNGEALGGDLLGREQLTVQPGETREFEFEFDPETEYIGVIAAYRDIEGAEWRSFAEIPQKSLADKINVFKKDRVLISVEPLAASITIGKP